MEEFTAAEGPEMLPCYVYWNFDFLNDATDFIYTTLRMTSEFESIHLWLTCLRGCLICTGLSLQGRKKAQDSKEFMLAIANDNAQIFITALHSLTRRWKSQRERGQATDIVLPSQLEATDDQLSHGEPEFDAQIYQCDAMEWSVAQWGALQAAKDEVISALQRGYIMTGPSAGWDRYHRDPEGLCAYPRIKKTPT
jgi:hypothetical protein